MATNNLPDPVVTNSISNQIVNLNAPDTTLDLSNYFDDPLTTGKVAHFNLANTSVGTIGNGVINVVLFDQTGIGAPLTVQNFQSYVTTGSYTNSFIHRSIPGFIVQGGGYTYDNSTLGQITANSPVQNEFSTKRSNLRGTIAMAKLGTDPNSATNQWFFNLADNSTNLDNQNGGFTVFGQAIADNDLTTIDAIAAVPIYNAGTTFTDLPLTNPAISDTNFVRFSSITVSQEDELKFSIVGNSQPTLVTPSISNKQLVLDYLPNQTGSSDITIRATNLFGEFVDYKFTATVLPNQIPTLNAIANPATILEDAVTQTINLSGISAGIGETQTLTLTATSNNPTLIANPIVTYNSANATATLSYTPIANQSGSALITVRLQDDGGTANGGINQVTQTFTINVTPVNDPVTGSPTALLATGTEDTPYTIQTTSLLQGFNDVDIAINGQSLSILNLTATNGILVNNNNGNYNFTPTANYNGNVTLTYDVTDSNGSTLIGQTRTFNLVAVNDAPLLKNSLADQTAKQGNAFNFQIPTNTFADIDEGDVLTYSATLENGNALPSWLTFDAGTQTFKGTPTNDNVGNLNVKVLATDKAGATDNDIFAIAVGAISNNSPTLANAIADQNAKQGNAFNFQVPTNTFTDIDAGDVLTYSALRENGNALPSWLTFNPTTRTFSGTPTNDNVGNLNIKVLATDKAGATVNDIFVIAVENLNDAPTLANAIADQNAKQGNAFNFQVPTNTFTDIDAGDVLTYSATQENGNNLPSWLTFNATTRTFSGTPTNADFGNLPIKVLATDNNGLIATDTFLLTVEQTKLAKIADDIFKISSSSGKSKIKVTLTGRTSKVVNELGVFTVDDAQGNIQGIAPGTAGYTQAALERSKVIFSAIASLPNGFNTDNLTHLLEFNSGDNLRFYLAKNSTTDAVKAGVTPVTDILFSDPLTQKITDLGNDEFSLAWKDGSGNNTTDFNNLVVKFSPTNDSLPLGTKLQGESQGEVIDLRDITGQVKADFVVNREAGYNNFTGFYKVVDENGGIDSNGDGKADIFAGQPGYIEAAVRGRVAGIDLTVNNQSTATYTGTFQPGSILVPFIIVNDKPDALLDSNPNNDPAIYFPFLGANADKVDHIRLLGNNVFGFEDLPNGGDKDFNDLIIGVKLNMV